MIFEQEYIAFELLDVMYIDQRAAKSQNTGRNFDALSLRLDSDTVITRNREQIELSGSSICYFPANVDYTRESNLDRMIVAHFNTFNYRSKTIECFKPERIERYKELFELLLSKWQAKEVAYKSECASILNLIFAELYRANMSRKIDPKIYDAVVYIEKNCMRSDFDIEVAAAKSFISPVYLRKLFKKEFGMSPKSYVIEQRINYARTLLSTGYYSVSEVADSCGYED
ncbi:MAG: helix-turn-helix transcriptional regulator, partial [Clostridia bacterium]|nr:helix-turn-helix transcriptional regulator [Clostridia bacterium]